MALEDAIRELTAAVKENTEAHAALSRVASAAAGGKKAEKPEPKEDEKSEDESAEDEAAKKKAAAAEKRRATAAKKKAEEAAKKKAAAPEATVSPEEFSKIVKGFLSGDDVEEDQREENKSRIRGAMDHLGLTALKDVNDDVTRAKIAAYIGVWSIGEDADFDEIDAKIDELNEGSESSDDDLDV